MSENHKIKWFSHKKTQIEVLQTCLLSVCPKENRPVSTVKTLTRNGMKYTPFSQTTDTGTINAGGPRKRLTAGGTI